MPTTLRVHGLDCADEAAELREALYSRPGVRELSFDVLRGFGRSVIQSKRASSWRTSR